MFNDVWAVQPGEKVPTIIVSSLSVLFGFTADILRWSREPSLGVC
jgi:hypothetical protein